MKSLAKAAIRDFFRTALAWIVRCTPKWTIYVLRGFPSYEDNLVAIYEMLVQRGVHRIIWVTDNLNVKPPIHIDESTQFVKYGSWRDYYYSIFSRYLFITHGHFITRIPSNQICVNLWHGIPYKVIGKLDGKPTRNDTMLVATSELTRDIFAKSFDIDPCRIAITGQARTDRLFVENIQAHRLRIFPEANSRTKFFLWLPTFRSTHHAGGRTDGIEFDNIFNCSTFDENKFNHYLAINNCVCFIKPHPMALQKKPVNHSNVIYVDENWLLKKEVTLYQFTGISDCLISDISSIIIDFMLLDRPIVLLFEDIRDYEATRGFSFNPISDWLPTPVALTFDKFMDEVDAVVRGEDRYRQKRNLLKSGFFKYEDSGSSARILDYVFNPTNWKEHDTFHASTVTPTNTKK